MRQRKTDLNFCVYIYISNNYFWMPGKNQRWIEFNDVPNSLKFAQNVFFKKGCFSELLQLKKIFLINKWIATVKLEVNFHKKHFFLIERSAVKITQTIKFLHCYDVMVWLSVPVALHWINIWPTAPGLLHNIWLTLLAK